MNNNHLKLVTQNQQLDIEKTNVKEKAGGQKVSMSIAKNLLFGGVYCVWLTSVLFFLPLILMFSGITPVHEAMESEHLGLYALMLSVILLAGFAFKNKFPKGDLHGF